MKKILVASSSISFIERNSTLLRRSEFQICSAESFASALVLVNEQGINLIIIDINLTDMDGGSFCRNLRSELPDTDVKMILVCRDDPEEFKRLSQCGADALIAKPIKPLQLVKTVGQFLTVHMVRSRRVSLRVRVISMKDSVEFFCLSHNISLTGMLIETEYFLEVGSLIQCFFAIPNTTMVETEGEVVRTARTLDGAHLYGIQFTSLGRTYREELDNYIASMVRNDLPEDGHEVPPPHSPST